MNNTIREKAVAALLGQIRDRAAFGLVVEMGTLEPQQIAAQLQAGKFVAEVITTDDEQLEEPIQFEEWAFEAAILTHLPKIGSRTPSSLAADAHGEVYAALCVEANRTLAGMAIDTQMIGGGAAGIDPQLGTMQGFSLVRVHYRHKVGDPTQ